MKWVIFSISCFYCVLSGCGQSADSYYNQAIVSAQKGDYDQAIKELEAATKSEPLSAKLYYGLGVIYTEKKMLNEALTAFNKAVAVGSPKRQLTMVDNADKTAWLLKGLTIELKEGPKHVFTEEEVLRPSYSMESMYYIWRCINYKKISEHIVEGSTTAEAKVLALLDWTHRNISLGAGEDFVALPLDIMLRGSGLCDKSAYVLATLADQLGYPSAVVDLRRQNNSHAVALVFIGGKWVIVDPCIGLVFRNPDQSIATLDDILHHPELTQVTNFYRKMGLHYFENYLIAGPIMSAWAGLPRMKIIQEVFNEFSSNPPLHFAPRDDGSPPTNVGGAPKIYHNLYEDISFALQSLFNCHDFSFPFKDKDGTLRMCLYGFPFGLRLDFNEGRLNKMQKEEIANPSFFALYYDARLAYLSGNYQEALTQYDALLKTSPNEGYTNKIEYFKCLCWFDGKEYANAIQALEKYLKDYPESNWKNSARYHLARSYEATAEYLDLTSESEAVMLYQIALEEYAQVEISDVTDAVVPPRMKQIEERLGE